MFHRYSTKGWICINIVLPMLPFLGALVIRAIIAITMGKTNWETFSAPECAICLTMLSIFINQSLLRDQRILDNEDKQTEAEEKATDFLILAIFSLLLFVAITSFNSILVAQPSYVQLEKPMHVFEIMVFIFLPFVIWRAVVTQKTYRLKSNLL